MNLSSELLNPKSVDPFSNIFGANSVIFILCLLFNSFIAFTSLYSPCKRHNAVAKQCSMRTCLLPGSI